MRTLLVLAIATVATLTSSAGSVQAYHSQPPDGGPIDAELGERLRKKKQAVKVGKEYYRIWNGTILFY